MTPSRIVFAGDGPTARRGLAYLADRPEISIVGLLLHPAGTAREAASMQSLAPTAAVIEGDAANTPAGRRRLAGLAPDWLISLNYAVILRPDTLALFPPDHAVNIHTGLLPEQRGRYPNFWALCKGGPGGITLHIMTAGIDEGDILMRREVPADWTDTAETLYARLQDAALTVLQESLAPLLAGRLARVKQSGTWPIHKRADFLALRDIDLDAPTTARALFNRLRAFAFPGDAGATFRDGDRLYGVSLRIQEIDPTLPRVE